MATPVDDHQNISLDRIHGIQVILFDMNGTLRMREPHEPTQLAANARILELLGGKITTDLNWEELEHRYKAYGKWAQENLVQASEKEIWTRWMLPKIPGSQIEPIASELTLAWVERKGHTVPKPDAKKVLIELKKRGYRLGVISNSLSSLDIPRTIQKFGWIDLLDVVILSSSVRYRKPAPEIFWEATGSLKVELSSCAFIGNRKSKDLVGCKLAGFALGILFEETIKPKANQQDQTIQPDMWVNSLSELLYLFPDRLMLEPRQN
jgi:putative hydrolase of the HAD superfamily